VLDEPPRNCHDNAVMEAFFSSVTSETADRFASCGEAKMELFDYIEVFYSHRRRHSTIGYVSPVAFERAAAPRESVMREHRSFHASQIDRNDSVSYDARPTLPEGGSHDDCLHPPPRGRLQHLETRI
jgi:hypothetical protein